MKDKKTQKDLNKPLTYERKQELIENIRQAFLRLINENEDEQFDQEDIEKVKQFNWIIERHLMNTNWKNDLAFKNLIENLRWRRDFGVNKLKEEDFPVEFYKSGSFFDYEPDKLGHSIITVIGRLHIKIAEFTPLFKKFFVFIVNKVENEVYFNLDKINKPNKENFNNGNIVNNDKDNAEINGKDDENTINERKSSNRSLGGLRLGDKNDEHNRLNGFAVFWDCNGAGLANVDMDILSFMVKTITTNFPMGLTHVYIYELPWILQAVLTLVRSWIPEYYLNAIILVNRNDLLEYFDINNLPAYLNGKCDRKCDSVPKSCLSLDQIAQINGISASSVKKLRKHIDTHCK